MHTEEGVLPLGKSTMRCEEDFALTDSRYLVSYIPSMGMKSIPLWFNVKKVQCLDARVIPDPVLFPFIQLFCTIYVFEGD